MVIAILAATLAGAANAGVAWLHGSLERTLENDKSADLLELEGSRSEANRILEVIKVGDPR